MAEHHSTNRAFAFDAVIKRKPIATIEVPRSLNSGPKTYAVRGDGNCLAPLVDHGDTILCDPDQEPEPGDLIAIWWKDGSRQPLIKRLTMGLPPREFWTGGGNAEFLLMCEQLNPPRAYSFRLSAVQAVHKVIHHLPAQAVAH